MPLWNLKYNFIENASLDEMDLGFYHLVYVSMHKCYLLLEYDGSVSKFLYLAFIEAAIKKKLCSHKYAVRFGMNTRLALICKEEGEKLWKGSGKNGQRADRYWQKWVSWNWLPWMLSDPHTGDTPPQPESHWPRVYLLQIPMLPESFTPDSSLGVQTLQRYVRSTKACY